MTSLSSLTQMELFKGPAHISSSSAEPNQACAISAGSGLINRLNRVRMEDRKKRPHRSRGQEGKIRSEMWSSRTTSILFLGSPWPLPPFIGTVSWGLTLQPLQMATVTISIVPAALGNFSLTVCYLLSQGMLHPGHSKSSAKPHRGSVT